jgi:hypothetical protein
MFIGRSYRWSRIAFAVCSLGCIFLLVYVAKDKGVGEPQIKTLDGNFDRFSVTGYSARIFDAGAPTASLSCEQLSDQKRIINGLRFESYTELQATKLRIEFTAVGSIYRPKTALQQIIGIKAEDVGEPSAERMFGPVSELTGSSTGQSPGDHEPRAGTTKVTRMVSNLATIIFRLNNSDQILVTSGRLQAHIGNYGLVHLDGGVSFFRDDALLWSTREAIWVLDTNTFYSQEMRQAASSESHLSALGGGVACTPHPEDGLCCHDNAGFPTIPADPVVQAASVIRVKFYQKLGLCRVALGAWLCDTSKVVP